MTMLELYLTLKLMQCVCVSVCVAACAQVNWLGKKLLPLGHIAQVATGNWQLAPVQACTWRQVLIVFPFLDACRHPRCIFCGLQESQEGVEELRVEE